MQQLNARASASQLRNTSTSAPGVGTGTPGRGTPVPGTPRGFFVGSGGVLGMSAEDLALESTAALKEKRGAPGGPITKTKRTWWGGQRTVTIEPADRDVEAGPEPRKAMLLAPLYNGLAVALSVCELHFLPTMKSLLGGPRS